MGIHRQYYREGKRYYETQALDGLAFCPDTISRGNNDISSNLPVKGFSASKGWDAVTG